MNEPKCSRKHRKHDGKRRTDSKRRDVVAAQPYRDEEFEAHLDDVSERGVSARAAHEMPWYKTDEARPDMPPLKVHEEPR